MATVGILRVTLYLEDTFGLKDKRQTVRSLVQQTRNKFNAAVAETADLDDPRAATITVAVVSNSAPHADEMLQTILSFVEGRLEMGVVNEVGTELIPLGD